MTAVYSEFPSSPRLQTLQVVCDDALRRIDEMASVSTTRIRVDVPEYTTIPYSDHVMSVAGLHSLAYRRMRSLQAPTESDLQAVRALGRLRASQGVPLDSLVSACHVGQREIWETFRRGVPESSGLVSDVAAALMARLQLVVQAISAGYREGADGLNADRHMLHRRLITELLANRVTGEVQEIATRVGLDPDGDFIAVRLRALGSSERLLEQVVRVLARVQAGICMVSNEVVVLAQGPSADRLRNLLGALNLPAKVGVGLTRRGLSGATLSLGDAAGALAAARFDGDVKVFEEAWVWACLHAERDRLEPVVSVPREVALANPHLAETVRAFADSGFSINRTAEKLFVHPNTAAYRIDRWKSLSGLDLRTAQGLVISLFAVDIEVEV